MNVLNILNYFDVRLYRRDLGTDMHHVIEWKLKCNTVSLENVPTRIICIKHQEMDTQFFIRVEKKGHNLRSSNGVDVLGVSVTHSGQGNREFTVKSMPYLFSGGSVYIPNTGPMEEPQSGFFTGWNWIFYGAPKEEVVVSIHRLNPGAGSFVCNQAHRCVVLFFVVREVVADAYCSNCPQGPSDELHAPVSVAPPSTVPGCFDGRPLVSYKFILVSKGVFL